MSILLFYLKKNWKIQFNKSKIMNLNLLRAALNLYYIVQHNI